jgi:DivIVA domain-containing protein
MKDEAFHLTPLDIRRFDFGTALRGYDKGRVDEFRDQVANEVSHPLPFPYAALYFSHAQLPACDALYRP